ncbi:hypothetical protein P3339_06685 [Microbulbifer sp. MLAF003]|uniref:hypothetical protein n=1 Tax=unclassified Microbulbifer TaxID=2619833 RepID=UPI0024ADE0C6|nr:hypothetical protein [Microbulbifer sp. MLAF003]WHI52454.1 hypothetical protein P3339_06685 [Microbulbifer sp. MLAF003]
MPGRVRFLITALIMLLSSCATVELTDAGRDIQIVQQISISDLDKYYEVGEVACNFGFNARSAITNIKQCRTDLKNQAAQLGGHVIVIEHQQLGTGGGTSYGKGYSGCPNCISMVGTTYKEKDTATNNKN